jgi:4-amino-4-deoxy-L-arabinose transferase-like glycosyltransferase
MAEPDVASPPVPVTEEQRPGAPRRERRWLFMLVVAGLLAEMAFAMITTARAQTPTIDEPVYVGTAVVYLQQHDLRYNPEHPPLGKMIMEAGLAFVDPHLDPGFTGNQTALGAHLLYQSGNDPWRLMLAARLPMILLTLLFGLVVFTFAKDLTGRLGGVVALALYAFSPDLIAHGSLATLDVPAAGFVLTSAWLLWRARERPWVYLPLAALALGAALATRMNTLPAVPVLLLLVVLSVWHARRNLWAGVAAGGTVGLIALAVVWLSYFAVDPGFLHWTSPADVPRNLGLHGLVADWMPFPEQYRDGMRIQFGLENKTYTNYLLGREYRGPLWYYLPVALLIKTPLGMLALWLAGTVTMLLRRSLRAASLYVLVLPAVLLLAVLNASRDFGTRYVIFVPMFLAVAAACVVTLRLRWGHLVTAALVVFVAFSSVRTYPYYLPYSNEAFGGPSKTYLRLHDSNADWGQDLGRLADRLRERYPGEHVWLVYKGGGTPAYYGIKSSYPRRVDPAKVHGLLVVSNARIVVADDWLKVLLADAVPVDQVGHSITIFRRP